MANESGGKLLELSMDTWLAVYREDELAQDLTSLSLEQCEALIPNGPGGWRKVSAILYCLLREARAGRDEAERIRREAFLIKQNSEMECDRVHREAKLLVQRGDLDSREAKKRTEQKIADIKDQADKRFKNLRTVSMHKHNEHDILLGKLQAVLERQGKCLQDSEKVFEDHDEEIRELVEFSDKKFEEYEAMIRQMEDKIRTISLLNKELQDKINRINSDLTSSNAQTTTYLGYSVLPSILLFALYLWIYLTLPARAFEETTPRFTQIDHKVDTLRNGIERKIASLELDTATEFKKSKKKLSSLDKNLEEQFEMFQTNFQDVVSKINTRLELVETGLVEQVQLLDSVQQGAYQDLQELRSELKEELYEASTRFDEFMKPKLLLTKTTSKEEKRRGQEGVYLGLYEEVSRENSKPVYKMINGTFSLSVKNENQWYVFSQEKNMEEELFLQYNPLIPDIVTDRWKYPSHKTSLVHNVPCCRNLIVDQVVFTLTDSIQAGRGVWKSAHGILLHFHHKGFWTCSLNGVDVMGDRSTICPTELNQTAIYSSKIETNIIVKCL